MIITSGYIEDMKITEELLKKSAICRSRYLLDRNSICQDSLKLDPCLDQMLSLQKSAFDRIGLGYDFSSPSTTIFVSSTNNVEIENNDVKNELASENIDKIKSILGAPLSLIRKRLRTLGLRRETLC